MTIQTATLQERITKKKESLKNLKNSIKQHHFDGPMAGPKDFNKDFNKGWNKDGH